MSWNGSDKNEVQKHGALQNVRRRKYLSFKRFVLIGVIVVALCGSIVCFLSQTDASPSAHDSNSKVPDAIAEVPTVLTEKPIVVKKHEKPIRRTAKGTPIPDDVQPDERGVLRHRGGLRWIDKNDITIIKHPEPKRLFKHPSENQIAQILTLDPNKMAPFLVGHRPKFGKRFVDDFKASLKEPDTFPENENDEDRAVRKMVLETKKEMAEALQRGEDISQIMNDAQDELDRLVSYRDTIMKQLRDIKADENYSDNDVKDFIMAANMMLEKEGLQKLANPNLTFRQAWLARRRERLQTQGDIK